MRDCNKQVCRLCLVIAPICECETIEEIKKEKLQVLQIKINFDISNYAVACSRCLKILQDCFDFKSRITTLMDVKKISQGEIIGNNLCLEKAPVCQLCMSLIEKEAFNYTTDLKGEVLVKNLIKNCFPEVALNILVYEPLICIHCVSGLERYYGFMKNCREVEQRIENFCGTVNHCAAGEDNLEDMLIFKEYDLLSTPLIVKRECLDVENVGENITKCPKSEDIKCEEIVIKDEFEDELDSGAGHSGSYQLHDYDNLGETESSKGNFGKCEPEDKNHFCPICPYSTNKLRNLKIHIRTHSNNKRYCCTLCSFVTDASRLLFLDHMTTHKGATKKYGCHECSYETNRKAQLERHIIDHKDISQVEMHKCPLCPFKCKYKSKLVAHQKQQHNKSIKMYKCHECSFTSKYRNCLARHYLVHEDPKVANKFKCEKCPFRTKWQEYLKKHMNIHDEQRHSCDQCSYTSSHLSILRIHQLVHQADEGRQMYECNMCSYQAKVFHNVKNHMMTTHVDASNLPKYKCAHCPYETVVKSYLSSHIKWQHSRQNQLFKCELCEFCTWRKGNLNYHQLIHTKSGEAKWYYCATCDYKAIYKDYIKKHVKNCAKNKEKKRT